MKPERPDRLWKVADGLMLAAFGLSIVVQLNDPDPLPWIAIYGLASGACVLGMLGRGHWAFPALLGVISAASAAAIAPRVIGEVSFLDMFGAFEMESVAIEESREMYGLVIIAAWMGVLAVRWARARSRSSAA